LIFFISISFNVFSEDDIYQFDTLSQRENFKILTDELRCPKCQNQNLAGSNSIIAITMRDIIAEQLLEGKNKAEIKKLMVDRYGEFVLYKPPFNLQTAILWWTPILLLLIIGAVLFKVVSKRSQLVESNFSED